MSENRQLHLNLMFAGVGHHEAAWRLPESDPFAQSSADYFIEATQIAEAAKFDSIFFADSPVLWTDPRYRPPTALDPVPLLAAIAMKTERIGLIATVSTTFREPYDVAWSFASLDHISGGRVGWNIITTAHPAAAANFGREVLAHSDRYQRADEFAEVVTKLWDSWQDDAVVGDKDTGIFADDTRINKISHQGEQFRVQGPLNLPRAPQGHPVLVQAGSSEAGRELGSRWGEAIFVAVPTLADAQEFYTDIKRRAVARGRRREDVVVLPGVVPFLGSTEAEARAREQEFIDQIIPAQGLGFLSRLFGVDLTTADLDGPLPEVPSGDDVEGDKSRSALVEKIARDENLTMRQLLARIGGGRGHREFTGTPEQLADELGLWMKEGGADGFNVMPPAIPGDVQTFVDHVVPILRKRGLFREEYEGMTLRDHYGLVRPQNCLPTAQDAGAELLA